MKYIIRFKEAASDRTLAPPELRTLLAPRALDRKTQSESTETNKIHYTNVTGSATGVAVYPWTGYNCVA